MEETETIRVRKFWKRVLFFILFCLPLPIVFMLFRALAFQAFSIPSSSNEPNLMVGDQIFVSKSAYGYSKHSFSPFNFFSFEGRTGQDRPLAGDMVIFKYSQDVKIDFVKRVVGLPGDHIQMINGVLNINGHPVNLDEVHLPAEYYVQSNEKFFRETLPNGRSYVVADFGETHADNTEEYIVPPKHYFLLGDSRDNSLDSRFLDKVGYVSEDLLVGRVILLFQNSQGYSILNRPEEFFPKP